MHAFASFSLIRLSDGRMGCGTIDESLRGPAKALRGGRLWGKSLIRNNNARNAMYGRKSLKPL